MSDPYVVKEPLPTSPAGEETKLEAMLAELGRKEAKQKQEEDVSSYEYYSSSEDEWSRTGAQQSRGIDSAEL